ncbi:MAG TPA: response regulator transcription factor [Vicinamibacteria bacterium]|nr:response regulator transcription factor [Vicinamibacteria bacterium]
MRARILVVEDDPKTAASVRLYLEHAGFAVDVAADGRSGLERARASPPPDLVVLDRMLPRLDGMAVCRAIRETSKTPVIVLTARTTEADRLEGLDLGADDYVSKPFSPRELVARVRAVLRRTLPAEEDVLEVGDLRIDVAQREVRSGGRQEDLTPRELALLLALARSPGRVFTRAELVGRAFGPDSEALERTVDVHVANLRRKLDPQGRGRSPIETVFGVGYRYARPEPE